ncbi:MAG: hypothetical protein JXA52_07535 [Planctomycetes bacterium]|nr:hypothetical protein [Planctomycetota bacterium]
MNHFADCSASFENSVLRISNDSFERAWDFSQGAPLAVSVFDRKHRQEWVREGECKDSFRRQDLPLTSVPKVTVESAKDDSYGASAEHLLVKASLHYPNAELIYTHRIWPGLPIILSQLHLRKTGPGQEAEAEGFTDRGGVHFRPVDDRLDFFNLAPIHLAYHATAFIGQSDYHDNLVSERAGVTYNKEHLALQGNFLLLCDRGLGGGLLAIKLSPPPAEHLHYPGYDFFVSGRSLAVTGLGITPGELESGDSFSSYPYAIGITEGSREAGIELFYQLDRQRIQPSPGNNFKILSNTWGDGNRTAPVYAHLFSKEIEAGGQLGLTHCQIDAGWHQGDAFSVFVESEKPKSTYEINPAFWEVNLERFPEGFEPIVAKAKAANIRLGFWFAPDRSNDYANWERDREVIIGMWKKYGFDSVKIDGVSILNKRAEANFLSLLQGIYVGSQGKICINFDITGGKSSRLGYFYGSEFTGNLFVENRYICDTTYFTFRTLRNLWQLSRYLPTYRLHMEFTNTKMKNERYAEDDPLVPMRFGTEFSCAVALFSNPLCWMEVANLEGSDRQKLSKLLHAYRPHQEAILCGRVYPLGEEPSGRSWTGFQSVTGFGEGYLIIFRELTARPLGEFILHGVTPGATLKIEKIAGASRFKKLKVDKDSTVRISLPGECSYALLKYSDGHPK